MPTDPLAPEDWYPDAIDVMLRERATLEQAIVIIGKNPLTPIEVDGHRRRHSFRELYTRMERAFYANKGTATANSKEVIVGKMTSDADALRAAGRLKEASEIELAKAKVLGIVGSEGTTNIFADLTGEGMAKVRALIAAKRKDAKHEPTVQ